MLLLERGDALWTGRDASVIQFHFNWNHVSVIAGLSRTNRLRQQPFTTEDVAVFAARSFAIRVAGAGR